MEQLYPEFTEFSEPEGRNLRDYLQILSKRRWTIITVFLIVAVIFLILGFGKTPLYTSSTTVLVEKSLGGENLGAPYNYYNWDPEFLPTQIEIIKSKSVTRRVVDSLQLASRYHSYFFPDSEQDKSFFDQLRDTVSSFFQELFSGESTDSNANDLNSPDKTEVDEADIIASSIQGGIEVKPVRDTRILNISYTGRDPYIAKQIVDALAKAYIDVSMEIKLSSTQQALQWMTKKAEIERKKLEQSERALQQYKRTHDIVTVDNKLTGSPEKLSQVTAQLADAENKLKELQAVYEQISRLKGDSKALETIPTIADNPTIVSLRSQILKAEQVIKELSKKYGYKHPKMIKAVDDRNLLLKEKKAEILRITQSIRQDYELARSQLETLKKTLAETKNELLDVNERFVQYSIMYREVEANRAVYDALTASLKKASTTEDSQSVNIWVMRPASLATAPSNKNPRKVVLMAVVLGLCSGIGIAFLLEYLDNTVTSAEELEERFDVTVLGTIPEAGKDDDIESIVQSNAASPITESYRLIRSSLLLSSADQPPRTLLVTSTGPQEGKTTTSINLARTMALGEKRVLLIDADMRRPRIHTIFGLDNTTGLSSYLSGISDDNIIHPLPGEQVSIIPSGPLPPNPAELLESKKMQSLLREKTIDYDAVIIDSPPIGQLVDGLVISSMVDGTVLVSRAGKTTYEMFKIGLKKLQDVQSPLLGVVLNGLTARLAGSRYYHYYQYYSKDRS